MADNDAETRAKAERILMESGYVDSTAAQAWMDAQRVARASLALIAERDRLRERLAALAVAAKDVLNVMDDLADCGVIPGGSVVESLRAALLAQPDAPRHYKCGCPATTCGSLKAFCAEHHMPLAEGPTNG